MIDTFFSGLFLNIQLLFLRKDRFVFVKNHSFKQYPHISLELLVFHLGQCQSKDNKQLNQNMQKLISCDRNSFELEAIEGISLPLNDSWLARQLRQSPELHAKVKNDTFSFLSFFFVLFLFY